MADELDHKNHSIGTKCDECGYGMDATMPAMAMNMGGPKTFAEMDDLEAQAEMAEEMARLTSQFQQIMANIMNDMDMTAAQKASAANALVAEFSQLSGEIQPETKELDEKAGRRLNRNRTGMLRNIHQMLGKVLGWAEYEDGKAADMPMMAVDQPHGGPDQHQHPDNLTHPHENGTHDPSGKNMMPSGGKAQAAPSAEARLSASIGANLDLTKRFKIFTDPDGRQRWLSFSSNAFEDLEKELFTTEALKEAVAWADKSGERGPLLIYHVPSAEVGQCDFQAVTSRFLVESGTFDDTPLGLKALDYFVKSDEDHQMSIGYQYRPGDELDGQYDWLRVIERSVCPFGTAANPWTDFQLIADGGKTMDANKTAVLEKIFGKDMAAGIISQADEKTKELEASTRFKTKDDEGEGKKEGEGETPPAESVVTIDQVAALGGLISDLTAQVAALAPVAQAVEQLATQVKELQKSDDEKIAGMMAPRVAAIINQTRPTEAEANALDPESVKALNLDGIKEQGDVNPALKYLEQLTGPIASG